MNYIKTQIKLTDFLKRQSETWIEISDLVQMEELFDELNKRGYKDYKGDKWDIYYRKNYFIYHAKYYINNKHHDIYSSFIATEDVIKYENIKLGE